MIDYDGRPVIASGHAIIRARERHPINQGADTPQVALWVERVAARALRDGRIAKRCPRWIVPEDAERRPAIGGRHNGESRYGWNEDETVVVVIIKTRKENRFHHDRAWVVLTVLYRPDP